MKRRNWIFWLCLLGIFVPIVTTLGPDFFSALRSYTWKQVPCTILRSSMAEEPFSPSVLHYKVKVEYAYTFDGHDHKSTRFTTGRHPGSTEPTGIQKTVGRLTPGTRTTCYVNPRNPAEAVLKRGKLWAGLFLLTPFVIVGLMTHEEIFAWFEQRKWRRRTLVPLPMSETNEAMYLDKRSLLFAILALMMGVFLGGFCVVHPLSQWLDARDWQQTAGVLTRSELTSRSGMHGPEYSLEVGYNYEFGAQKYRSTHRTFTGPMDEPVADLAAWAAAHRAGSPVRVFVNPRNPTEAVLDRTIKPSWVSLSLGLLMLAFGSLMGLQCVKSRWQRNRCGAELLDGCLGKVRVAPAALRVFPSPLISAIGCAIASILAGTAGAWSLYHGIRALLQGHGDMINLLYGAMASVGALCLVKVTADFLKRASHSRPVLEIVPGTPLAGKEFRLKWRFIGPRQVIPDGQQAWLKITLEGYEEAKVRHLIATLHGTMSEEKKERSQFSNVAIAHQQSGAVSNGSATVVLPPNTMHSFRGAKSAICWEIKFEFGVVRDGHAAPEEKLEYRFPVQLMPARS